MTRNIAMSILIPEEKEGDFRLFTVLNGGEVGETEKRELSYKGYFINTIDEGEYSVYFGGSTHVFTTVNEAIEFINKSSKKPMWDVTFIWGYSLKVMTLTVPADDEKWAVEAAFQLAGSSFENQLISVKRRGSNE